MYLEELLRPHVLGWAAWRAARGKRDQPDVQRFFENLDQELLALREDALSGAFPFRPMNRFLIHDPKTRSIEAPCLRERVLHHALA